VVRGAAGTPPAAAGRTAAALHRAAHRRPRTALSLTRWGLPGVSHGAVRVLLTELAALCEPDVDGVGPTGDPAGRGQVGERLLDEAVGHNVIYTTGQRRRRPVGAEIALQVAGVCCRSGRLRGDEVGLGEERPAAWPSGRAVVRGTTRRGSGGSLVK
jgi:hypothetical protein